MQRPYIHQMHGGPPHRSESFASQIRYYNMYHAGGVTLDWYYQEDGLQVGPLTEDEFETRVQVGRVGPATMVWNDTMTGWQPYESIRRGAEIAKAPMDRMPQVACSQCLREFPQTEMIRYQNSWICASCKPLFFQKLKEGGSVSGIYEYGQFWPRFAAKLIDGLILGLVYGMFFALNVLLAIAFPEKPALQGLVTLLAYVVYFGVAVGYNAYFLPKYGATPGKMALGLKVINVEGGGPVNVQKAVGRYFAEILSGMMCYVGYFMALFDEERRTLHDRLCNTLVVKK